MPSSIVENAQISHGIKVNRQQIIHQLVQVFLVGCMIGLTRTVLPGLASAEFGLAQQQFVLLTTFVVVFGLVKAAMNLFAGRLSERFGRRPVLIAGWLVALPIPFILYWAPNWYWIIVATVFLGLNQGLSWSMALNSKLDLAKASQRGLVNGLNEFSGYAAVGIAGLVSASLAVTLGAREALFVLSLAVMLLGLYLAICHIEETKSWSDEHAKQAEQGIAVPRKNGEKSESPAKSFKQLFAFATWQDKPLVALNQAGLVEKFVDALIWVLLPVYLLAQNISLVEASAIITIYGVVWGGTQLITGPLSDKIGRKALIVGGMWICGIGSYALIQTNTIWIWSLEAALIGVGMAMLYPTLGAAVADNSSAHERASLLGVYRFWRDFGYAIGALLMGLVAQYTGQIESAFELVAVSMLLSGLLVVLWVPSKRP
ncbi:MFS transporter [Thiomicrorhabdus immobilis]|uniref:MFS transporter n=1 Tax=Thiomicrorhabdus immobilis TaxID=2791037 RepID=A0ABM7MAE0_9GAMM|nr:MFS transporter [Thiomicrorhabdus immobilis]BCN92310.1 MFS transporter [Thiomicrorhabdus immobilis]